MPGDHQGGEPPPPDLPRLCPDHAYAYAIDAMAAHGHVDTDATTNAHRSIAGQCPHCCRLRRTP